MKRPFALLLTVAIVGGIPIGVMLLVGLVVSKDTSGVVGTLVGWAFGTFVLDIYRALLGASAATPSAPCRK